MALRSQRSVKGSRAHSRSVAFCGLSVALMALCAWITLPLGPVPFTLQTFAMAFTILVLSPKDAICSVLLYIGMGAVGLPVFSSMRGGFAALAGPTGGFIWGFLLGAIAACMLLSAFSKGGKLPSVAVEATALALFIFVSYACGLLQLMHVANMDALTAFVVSVAPFVIADIAKMAFAVLAARAVRNAIGLR